jgi:hypothetical protein
MVAMCFFAFMPGAEQHNYDKRRLWKQIAQNVAQPFL